MSYKATRKSTVAAATKQPPRVVVTTARVDILVGLRSPTLAMIVGDHEVAESHSLIMASSPPEMMLVSLKSTSSLTA